ncbi:ABC transporter ATP-binding protein [Priestia koreensis]|uniref:ABC transporter ATP-binding protein n=1 Tax=Priestia koreensis TaxID=284581 RepID=UPI0037C694C0
MNETLPYMNEKLLLEVKNLESSFEINGRYYNAVDNVTFEVKRKQVLGIVGESGCGKSALSLSIMGLLPKGKSKMKKEHILFQGSNLHVEDDQEMQKIRGNKISMIFQEPMTSLNPTLTIGYQLQEILLHHERLSKVEAMRESISLLKKVGISHAERIVLEYPHQLSGGMRQRVMIAMAIACKPNLLIADEPTTALDVTVQAQVLELLKELQNEHDMSIIMITHDLGVVAEMCDDVIVMYAGKIIERADVDTLFYHAKHPYTKALLNSIPKIDQELERLNTIDGIVPSLSQIKRVGCPFADRCPQAFEKCRKETPQLVNDETDHEVACFLYERSYEGVKVQL